MKCKEWYEIFDLGFIVVSKITGAIIFGVGLLKLNITLMIIGMGIFVIGGSK